MNPKNVIKSLAKYFGEEKLLACLPQHKVREALGLVTALDMARSLGMTYEEFRWQLSSGSIPHPTHKLVRRCFYTQGELDSIKKSWKRNG